VVRVVYRLKAANLNEEALARSWRQAMSAICRNATGAIGGQLLRSEKDRHEYVIVTRWESVEAWRDFWSKGPPEPQGDPALNEFFLEIDSTDRESSSAIASNCRVDTAAAIAPDRRRGTQRIKRDKQGAAGPDRTPS
jgi:heme-degrading monooxygenase HmoA